VAWRGVMEAWAVAEREPYSCGEGRAAIPSWNEILRSQLYRAVRISLVRVGE
jgi:hypothetical protein